MRLAISFEADQRPEAQHQLRQIPSAQQVDHPELKAALERYESARGIELEARRAHTQAEQELPAAEYRDELALADAQEKGGRKDPGPVNAEKQIALIRECKRTHGAAKIALARAIDGVAQAFAEHGDEWEHHLEAERDERRDRMARKLDEWVEDWRGLQRNSANRAIARGSGTQAPNLFAGSFRVPVVRDGDVIQVDDVLVGLRGLAAREKPNDGAVENRELGAEPTRHRPPSKQPFAGMESEQVALGQRVPDERVRDWLERDEAEARRAGEALAAERRAERAARADTRRAEREAVRDADNAAAEAV